MSDFDANPAVGEGAPASPPVTDVPMKRDRARLRRPEPTPSTPPRVKPPAADAPSVSPATVPPTTTVPPIKPVTVTPAADAPAVMPAPVTPPARPAGIPHVGGFAPANSSPDVTPAVLTGPAAIADPVAPVRAYPNVPPAAAPHPMPVSQPAAPDTATSLFAALQPDVADRAPEQIGLPMAQPAFDLPSAPAGEDAVNGTSLSGADTERADNPALPGIGLLTPTPMPEPAGLRGLEITAFITAILLPPLGLILAIVAQGRGKTQRGWVSDLVRYAIPLATVLTIVLLGAAAVWFFVQGRADASAEVALTTSSLFPVNADV